MEYTQRICYDQGKKGIVPGCCTVTQGTTACCSKSVLSNHNETLLSLFSGSNQCQLHHVCMEQLFNLVSLCYNYKQSKDHLAFNVVILKLFGAKHPL